MALDESGIQYSSNWDIDQIVSVTPTSSPGGDVVVGTFTGDPPVFEVMAKPTGETFWVQPGRNGVDFGPNFIMVSYISGTDIHVLTSASCDIRCYIWSDKVTQ
jgi:hypothetical protein